MKPYEMASIVVLFAGTVLLGNTGRAENMAAKAGNAAVPFLRIIASTRANGMGECAANLVDERSAMHNPGALGLFHLNRIFAVNLPATTEWLPSIGDDMELKSFSISGGVSSGMLTDDDAGYNIGLGLAYSRLRLNEGRIELTDATGATVGYSEPYESADFFTLAAAVDAGIRLGVGVTYKKIDSYLGDVPLGPGTVVEARAKGDALDFGLLLEAPISRVFGQRILMNESSMNPIVIDFVPSLAFVLANVGDEMAYTDVSQTDPLPKTSLFGLSAYGSAVSRDAPLGSLRLSWQMERAEYGDKPRIYRYGLELGFLGAAYLRAGRIDDDPGRVYATTWGFGLDTHGASVWIMRDMEPGRGSIAAYLVEHASLSFDYAGYVSGDSPLDDTRFLKLSLAF